ncbi:hypothetical protein [Rhizomicrobium electricum]|uniref:Uncharacterized protein n=1 Tax=Rhizomicrobium electricum TaxID=480070 RepID=A0ABP3QD09_9PROT|nr:hypothetical protein [Rhizomicrobium electricum]NIJ50825.1 hypothetical protein [Rhizomicrobium electricum]
MIRLDDPKWMDLMGGYRVPYDPRGALQSLSRGHEVEAAWAELWNELHHQGDVGEASYASVPVLVSIHAERGIADWNTYALVAIIEVARRMPGNPELPSWLKDSYDDALRQLAEIGLQEFRDAKEPGLVNGIIAVLAFSKDQPLLGRFAMMFTEDERREILKKAPFG